MKIKLVTNYQTNKQQNTNSTRVGNSPAIIRFHSQPITDTVSFSGKLPIEKLKQFDYSKDFLAYFSHCNDLEKANEGDLIKGLSSFLQKFDVNSMSYKQKHTPLHILVLNKIDKPQVIKFIIKKDANPNAKTTNGITPLDVAAWHHLKKTINVLLKHGARGNNVNEYSRTGQSIDSTALLNSLASLDVIPDPELTKILLKNGAKETINVQGNIGRSALHLAVLPYDYKDLSAKFKTSEKEIIKKQKENIELILQAGIDTKLKDWQEKTAFETIGSEKLGFFKGEDYGFKAIFEKYNIKE